MAAQPLKPQSLAQPLAQPNESDPSKIRQAVASIDTFSEITGRVVSWLTLGMMIITSLVVLLRYGFEWGSIALQETITYLHAAVFLLGAAYTLKQDSHVRVDIFYRRFSPQQKAWINSIGGLVFLLPMCVFLVGASWEFVAKSWEIGETSANPGGIPAVFILKTLVPIAAVTLALQGIAEILRSLILLIEE